MIISIIVATSENNVIGNNEKIPWHCKEDLKHFKQLTLGHHILMGRKTFESIGKTLPDRTNLIISNNKTLKIEGTVIFQDFNDAVKFARNRGEEELFIIGGQSVYEIALPQAEKIYQTLVLQSYEGDTLFPKLLVNDWKETENEKHLDLNPPITFRTLERR